MKLIYSLVAALFMVASVRAQAPEKMSYQAVIRNASNTLVTNQNVQIRISILQGSASGTAVYVETQTPTTNANGLVSLEIGAGSVVLGTFSGINWGSNTYFVKTETDPAGGTSYSITGTSQILSVPYALNAKNGIDVLTKAERDALSSPVVGKVIYQTDEYKGLYAYDGTSWRCQSGDCPITYIEGIPNAAPVILDGSHHTIYIYGTWAPADQYLVKPIRLPNPTTCLGRKYTIIVTNNYINSPPNSCELDAPNNNAEVYGYVDLTTGGFSAAAFPNNNPPTVADYTNILNKQTIVLQSNGQFWFMLQK